MNSPWLALILLTFALPVCAAGGESRLERVDADIFDTASVRRGAGLFANYCLGCHSLKQMRYSRIGKDLGLSEEEMRREFMFGDVKIHDAVRSAMTAEAGATAFGVAPPDLSLTVRAKGADWVFSYLKGFYVDAKRPYGVNNLVVENVAMPNVLWELQGTQEPIIERIHGVDTVVGVSLVKPGLQSPEQFTQTVTDIVTFLDYVAEPSRLERLPLGKYVLLFVILMTYVFHRVKKEYWKDIS